MNIVAKSELNFHGVNLTPVSEMQGIWLTSADVAKALHYSSTKSVTNLFNQYSDEFSPGMTMVIESMTNGINGSSRRMKTRVFSLRGAHLLAMFARTPVAKEFRKWVLDILDREVEQSPIGRQFTDEELRDLCWLWKASAVMASKIADVEPILRVAEHRLAGAYYSMPREYSRTINRARMLLERETSHVEESFRNEEWRVLENLRLGRMH
nr:P22AR C-terminal domain-containing protein [Cronobacter turicensis]